MIQLGTDGGIKLEIASNYWDEMGNGKALFQVKYFYKAIGYFAATEFMTPRRFKNVIAAWQRNGLDSSGAEYHKEHIKIDAIHAKNWLKNAIVPVIDKNPDTSFDITRGVIYRINTSARYLDMLMSKFMHKQSC